MSKRSRLITLTGVGGSGKTRLALEVGRAAAQHFQHGVWFVDLGTLKDGGLVVQRIATSLKVQEQPGQSLMASLIEDLRGASCLLILDTCEHLLPACAETAQSLLESCPDVRVLATSRELLRIGGEVVWAVPPLTLPGRPLRNIDPRAAPDLSRYQESEAVQLFAARAATNSPGFTLNAENAETVGEICRRLDGMPLAIELATAQLRSLSVQEIAVRLGQRFDLLRGGSRTAPSRQQTLAATLDWSYGLLTAKEQSVLRRLSVFSGGAAPAALEAVCRSKTVTASEVRGLLAQLVDKSLTLAIVKDDDSTRYVLLDSVREYLLGRLTESEQAEAQSQHIRYFLALAKDADSDLRGSNAQRGLAQFQLEIDNFRTALNWALGRRDAEAALDLTAALSLLWLLRASVEEGMAWLERALEIANSAPAALVAGACANLGMLMMGSRHRDMRRIGSLLKKSLRLYRELGDRAGVARVLSLLGIHSMLQGKLEASRRLLDESLALCLESGDPWEIANTLQNLAPLLMEQGDLSGARRQAEATIEWFERAGDQRGLSRTLMDLAEIARREGDSRRAAELLEQSILNLVKIGDAWSAAGGLEELVKLEMKRGKLKNAALLGGAMEAFREASHSLSVDGIGFHGSEGGLQDAKARLGKEEFDRAWSRGRSMSLMQVATYLRRGRRFAKGEADSLRFGGLTPREREAALLITEGKSNREAAAAMGVSVKAVEAYVTRILRKLGFRSRVEIATWVGRHRPD